MSRLLSVLLLLLVVGPASAEPDFEALGREALPLLQEYIRIPSVNPPAQTRAAAEFLQRVLAREGIEARLFESNPGQVNLLARLPGKSRQGSLMLLHHMDVVPADASRWPVDPFAAVIKDGELYGRGAVDMKSVGVMQIMTMIALKREKVPLEHDLLLLCTADEETGGEAGARFMIEHHWPELDPTYVLDEGGFGTRDLLSAEGKLVFGVAVGEKQILWARLVATGTSGHGSQPISDNANDRLTRALSQLGPFMHSRAGQQSPLVAELRQRVGPLAENKFTRAIQSDTMSLTSLRSGVGDPPKANVIPSRAEATLDFRLLPDTDLGALRSELQKLWPEGVELEEIHSTSHTPVSSHQTPLFHCLEKALKQEYPEAVVTPYLVPFGTDSNSFRQKGAQAYGFGPAVVNASIVASMHSDSERLPVAQIEPSLRIYYRAVAGYLAP
ncbi:MAG: peptidase M20 [Candidatus Xenobia bacterium]|jgi:acetylornithine deacetylase/succinyl-diaminopimelate desuccinylase-like protein